MHEGLDNSISREEVDEAIRLLKNSKAPGEDGLPNKIWKIASALTDNLVEVCNHALEGEDPKEWVDCTITPIYKKGSPNDPDNYRGIALLSTGGKVFSATLTRRLQRVLVPDVVPESQYGYRPGKLTEDLIYVLRQLFEKAWEKNTPMYAIFIDFHKAFNSVDRELLWEVLSHFGVPPKCLSALRNLHTNMEGQVAYRGELESSPSTLE